MVINHQEPMPRPEPQDTATIASRMIYEWTCIDRRSVAAEFDEFWGKVEKPEHLISVWQCRFIRANRWGRVAQREFWEAARKDRAEKNPGQRFTPEEEEELRSKGTEILLERIGKVKARIAKELPPVLQAVVALGVKSGYISNEVYSTEELSTLANKYLTRDFAIKCLKGEPPFSDPYLFPSTRLFSPYGDFCKNLLLAMKWQPEDSDLILQLEAENNKQRPSYRLTEWPIAASRAARNDKAKLIAILKDAMQRWDPKRGYNRWLLAKEIWDTAGTSEGKYLIDLFYGDIDILKGIDGSTFLPFTVGDSGDEGRRFIRVLVCDARSESIPASTMIYIARLTNKLAREDVISDKELRNLRHPTGLAHAMDLNRISITGDIRDPRKRYPKETEAVVTALTDWRKRITDYVEKHDW